MISPHNHLASSFCLGMVLLSLGFLSSCKTNPPDNTTSPDKTNPPDAREELVRSLKGANVDGYLFATKEEHDQIITSLTNGALRNPIKLDSTKSLVLGYASVKDKKTNATKTLKAEVVKADNATKLHVTDIGLNELLINEFFVPRTCPSGGPIFNNGDECFDDFNCKVLPGLQCEANRTCKNLYFELECCLKNGTRLIALIIIVPTDRKCQVAFPFDIDTLVLSPE